MTSAWIVSAAWRRFDVTRLVLAQRRRLCDELAARGIDARALVVADDENLEIAAEYGCDTLEHPNDPLGRKCNAGFHHALAQGADWIVWVGSDDWIHPDTFDPLLETSQAVRIVNGGTRIVMVDLPSGRLQELRSPSKYGAIPWLIDRRMFSSRRDSPIRPDYQRGLDSALLRGLRRSSVRFETVVHSPHRFRCVDLKSAENLSPFAPVAQNLGIGEPQDAWDALTGWYPADLIADARALSQSL